MKTELSTTIIRSGPSLFENISRRAWIKKRPGGNAPGYVTRAIDIGGFSGRRAFRNGDTGNPRFHLNALFQNVLKRLAAPRGDPGEPVLQIDRRLPITEWYPGDLSRQDQHGWKIPLYVEG